MNPLRKTLFTLAAAGSLFTATASPVWAGPAAYQVTGPITAMTDTTITVQKGKEQWEVAKDANTKTTGDMKVGDKVTVHYMMTATAIDSKPAATATAPAKGKKADKAAPTAAKGAPGTTEVQKPAAESGPAASPATTPGQ